LANKLTENKTIEKVVSVHPYQKLLFITNYKIIFIQFFNKDDGPSGTKLITQNQYHNGLL